MADLYLINSCTVPTQRRRVPASDPACPRTNPRAKVVATGCYAQVAPDDLLNLPDLHLDLVLGNQEKHDLAHHIKQGRHQITDLTRLKASGPLRLTSFAEHTRAFLQIQNGCETGCSYCIVPIARGPSRSVPPNEVLEAVSRLVGSGYQEVVLTGIHMGAYGLDLSPPGSLTALVQQLEDQNVVSRLRLGSIEPNELTDELLALFTKSLRLCHHLHIPLPAAQTVCSSGWGDP